MSFPSSPHWLRMQSTQLHLRRGVSACSHESHTAIERLAAITCAVNRGINSPSCAQQSYLAFKYLIKKEGGTD